MGWVSGALQIGSALFGANQAGKAAKANQKSLQQGIDLSNSRYADAQGYISPFITGGQNGLSAIARADGGDFSGFQNSPDYAWNRDQMIYGADHSAAAKGRMNSGGYGADLAGYMDGLANNHYTQWRGGQMDLARLGAQSALGLGQLGASNAQSVSGLLSGQGQAKASAYGANAGAGFGIANTLGNIFAPSTQSSYNNFGVPGQVSPYANTSYGSGSWFG